MESDPQVRAASVTSIFQERALLTAYKVSCLIYLFISMFQISENTMHQSMEHAHNGNKSQSFESTQSYLTASQILTTTELEKKHLGCFLVFSALFRVLPDVCSICVIPENAL